MRVAAISSPSSFSSYSTSNRSLASLATASYQSLGTKRRLFTEKVRLGYSAGHLLTGVRKSTPRNAVDVRLYNGNHGLERYYFSIHGSINSSSRSRSYFGTAKAVSSPKKIQKLTKGARRSNSQRNSSSSSSSNSNPSYKRNDRTKHKSSKTKPRRPGTRKHAFARTNSKNSYSKGTAARDNNSNYYKQNDSGASSSLASSIVDIWDDDQNSEGIRNSNLSDLVRDDSSVIFDSGTTRRRSKNTFHLDRFRDKQQEFCEILEDYRLFWYPGSDKRQPQKNQHSSDEFHSDDDSSSAAATTSDWRTVVAFEHPDPNENFPWLDVSWEKIVESEELFRRVCAAHHVLFFSCCEVESDWDETDLLRTECDELFAAILPTWERLRRERALLVETYRPISNDSSLLLETQGVEQQQQQQQDRVAEPKAGGNDIQNNDELADVSYQNNKWVGWLKQMIVGTESCEDEDSNTSLDIVTGHSDPECAPDQHHYQKLVGHMYFHHAPLKRHNRSNPFHLYGKSERGDKSEARATDGMDNADGNNANDSSDPNRSINNKKQFQEATAEWDCKRLEILENRSKQMQYIVDQALLPPIPNLDNSSSDNSKSARLSKHREEDDRSSRVLTDKIIRLLIRSYLDIGTFPAAQQAERAYHKHPNHRKRLLWYVTMCYLKVIVSNNKELAKITAASNSTRSSSGASRQHQQQDLRQDRFTQMNQESATAAARICELVSSKHAKEAREFQHCSTIAFEALATVPQQSRRGLKGYYDRVHSMCILKFGPKVWEALLRGDDVSSTHPVRSHGTKGIPTDRSSRRRGRKTNRKTSVDASSPSTIGDNTSASSNEASPATTTKPPIDLSQALHSKDHKILNYLIQIYSNESKDLHRAMRLLKVSLDLYSPHALKESLDRTTFHKLLRQLSEQKRKVTMEQKKKQRSSSLRISNTTANGSSNKSETEFSTALGLLDSMVSDDSWFPNEETFRIVFSMIPYSENPGRDAERLRSKLEACRFLSGMSTWANHRPGQSSDYVSHEAPHLLHPLETSTLTLRAWLQTLHQHGGILPKSEEMNPSHRALAILRAMRVGASSLFNASRNDQSQDETDEESTPVTARSRTNPNHMPTAALYSLALEVCSRDGRSPKITLGIALDIFELLQTDGLLLEGTSCQALLGVLADFANTTSTDLLLARVEATKKVCMALAENDPCYGQQKPEILQFLKKQSSYLRLRHPSLYEEHLAELGILDDIGESDGDVNTVAKEASIDVETEIGDDTAIEGLGVGDGSPKA